MSHTAKESHIRCQSCGMPLGEGFYGTEADSSPAKEWCKFCYQNGVFTDATLTQDQMIAASIKHMTRGEKMSDEQASVMAHAVIPQLKRWRSGKQGSDPILNPKP